MKKITKKTLITLILAGVMAVSGAIGAFAIVRSGLPFESGEYRAWFYMNHLQVHLLENGRDVCGGENTLDGATKKTGELVQYLGYSNKDNDEVLGSVEPGMKYKEEIAARNGQDIPIYLRLIVRKYWMITDEDGKPVDKAPELSPDKIHLTYGEKDYNEKDWFVNEDESTPEQRIYYYRTQLKPNADTAPLFDSLVIDRELLKKEEEKRETDPETGVTKITYIYRYDGYAFIVKADVQAVQTHNAEDAFHSQWGVRGIKVRNGKLVQE